MFYARPPNNLRSRTGLRRRSKARRLGRCPIDLLARLILRRHSQLLGDRTFSLGGAAPLSQIGSGDRGVPPKPTRLEHASEAPIVSSQNPPLGWTTPDKGAETSFPARRCARCSTETLWCSRRSVGWPPSQRTSRTRGSTWCRTPVGVATQTGKWGKWGQAVLLTCSNSQPLDVPGARRPALLPSASEVAKVMRNEAPHSLGRAHGPLDASADGPRAD